MNTRKILNLPFPFFGTTLFVIIRRKMEIIPATPLPLLIKLLETNKIFWTKITIKAPV